MTIELDVQRIIDSGPSAEQMQAWVDAVMHYEQLSERELTVRIVDEAESAALNEQYRNKQGPTNVLSFPFECPPEVELNLLGDLVICAPVVEREAQEQQKTELAHWAHMLVHGCLHLLGYDHLTETEAHDMEQREIAILQELGFSNPYQIGKDFL